MTIQGRKGPGSNTGNPGHFVGRDASRTKAGQVELEESVKTEVLGGIEAGGDEHWAIPGLGFHRLHGPARQWDGGVANCGSEEWYVEGKRHRLDGPAARYAGGASQGGCDVWYKYGKCHRLDGPAVVRGDGSGEWWIEGERLDSQIQQNLAGITFESEQEAVDTIAHLKELQKAGQL